MKITLVTGNWAKIAQAKEFLEQNPDILNEIEAKVRETIATKNGKNQQEAEKEEK